jgi:hypothetical protein
MDINGSKGIFRVHTDVYLHSCNELEHLCESNELSFLCSGPNWQQMCFSDKVHTHYCISGKMCAVPDEAAAICEILNVWMPYPQPLNSHALGVLNQLAIGWPGLES